MGNPTDENYRKLQFAETYDSADLENMIDREFSITLDKMMRDKRITTTELVKSTSLSKAYINRLRDPSRKNNCDSELAKAHIEYYIEAMRKERNSTVQRIVLTLFLLSYLIFTLCRVWWYYHPDSNPFPETNYTAADLIQVIYLLTIIGIVLWGVRKAVSDINNRKR